MMLSTDDRRHGWSAALERARVEGIQVLRRRSWVDETWRDAFEVSGSHGGYYVVKAVDRPDQPLFVSCSCPAGERDQRCKHVAIALAGEGLITPVD